MPAAIEQSSSPSRPPAGRDAERSRRAILDAAEQLFAAHGFDGAGLAEIAAAAGLSRGTPSYFFGSKEQLYQAVLDRVFAERQAATAAAVAPIHDWCSSSGDLAALRRALSRAVDGYVSFLLARPAFVRLVTWEQLAGGDRLREGARPSNALEDAFGALNSAGRHRGLGRFRVDDMVVLWIGLTFAPVAFESTFLVAVGRDVHDESVRRRHVRFCVDRLIAALAPGRG